MIASHDQPPDPGPSDPGQTEVTDFDAPDLYPANPPPVPPFNPEAFLLAEHRRFVEAFAANEELGERRLQILSGLATAVFAAIGALLLAEHGVFAGQLELIVWIAMPMVGLVLTMGVFTFGRLLKRDAVSSEYQHALDEVRGCFERARAGRGLDLERYDPFRQKFDETLKKEGLWRARDKMRHRIGRLSLMMLGINVWLAVALGGLIGIAGSSQLGRTQGLRAILWALLLALASGFLQWWWWDSRYFNRNRDGQPAMEPARGAGGSQLTDRRADQ